MTFESARFGYVPYSADLTSPADRRRFCFWAAARGVQWEIADPDRRYDAVVVATNADLVRWRRHDRANGTMVYELIDSYLAIPPTTVRSRLRGTMKFASGELSRPVADYHRAMRDMCRAADAVVCSTPEQRETLLELNDTVHPILDAHLDLVHRVKDDYSIGDTINLVWEGLPYTLDDFLGIAPVLQELARRRPIALHLVTDLSFHRFAKRFAHTHTEPLARRILPNAYVYAWNELLLSEIVTACDIAVIPLDLDDPLARAKPENKLLIFWRLGMPAVTTATPAYRRVMADAGLDLTCAGADDWRARLEALIDDPTAREDAGRRGRAYVEAHHSRDAILDRWDRLFLDVLR